jgi:hypothetical protein
MQLPKNLAFGLFSNVMKIVGSVATSLQNPLP